MFNLFNNGQKSCTHWEQVYWAVVIKRHPYLLSGKFFLPQSKWPVKLLRSGSWCFVTPYKKYFKMCLFWTVHKQTYALLLEIHATEAAETVAVAVWAARAAADVRDIVVMERKHTATLLLTASRESNIFKGYYHNDVFSRNNSLYSDLSLNTAQKRHTNLILPFSVKTIFQHNTY